MKECAESASLRCLKIEKRPDQEASLGEEVTEQGQARGHGGEHLSKESHWAVQFRVQEDSGGGEGNWSIETKCLTVANCNESKVRVDHEVTCWFASCDCDPRETVALV